MAQKSKSAREPAKPVKGKAVAGAAGKTKTGSLVVKMAKSMTAKLAAVTKSTKAAAPAKAAKAKPQAEAKQIETAKKALATAAKAPAAVAKPAKAVKPAKAPAAPKVQHTMNPLNAKVQSTIKAAPAKEPKGRGRKFAVEINPNEAASALSAKWNTLYKKAEQIESKPYTMTSIFEEKTAIVHKVLGWGYILANRNDRLEVLFKDGIKYLISNYKP